MGKSTISMAIFNSYVSHYQRVHDVSIICRFVEWQALETSSHVQQSLKRPGRKVTWLQDAESIWNLKVLSFGCRIVLPVFHPFTFLSQLIQHPVSSIYSIYSIQFIQSNLIINLIYSSCLSNQRPVQWSSVSPLLWELWELRFRRPRTSVRWSTSRTCSTSTSLGWLRDDSADPQMIHRWSTDVDKNHQLKGEGCEG